MQQFPVNRHILVEVQKDVTEVESGMKEIGWSIPLTATEDKMVRAQDFSVVKALSAFYFDKQQIQAHKGDMLLVSTNMINEIKNVLIFGEMRTITIVPSAAVWMVMRED
jgi:hypothetical protein